MPDNTQPEQPQGPHSRKIREAADEFRAWTHKLSATADKVLPGYIDHLQKHAHTTPEQTHDLDSISERIGDVQSAFKAFVKLVPMDDQ